MEKKLICCWGDSVTEGMRMSPEETYPAQLGRILGEGYTVLNGGSGGERTETIMARRGARRVFLSKPLVFEPGEKKICYGTAGQSDMVTDVGEMTRLTAYLGMELPINPITVGTQEFTLSYEDWSWTPISGRLMLERAEACDPLVIPGGTEVQFNNTQVDARVDIVFMGANGGYDGDVAELVNQNRLFASRCRQCLVIVPYFRQDADALFDEAFGRHALNIRRYFCSDAAFSDAQLVPTEEDDSFRREGRVPPAFTLAPGDVHLNAAGYRLLALELARRMGELGLL